MLATSVIGIKMVREGHPAGYLDLTREARAKCPSHERAVKRTSWVALAALAGLFGYVIWSSLRLGGVRCEVCIEYGGRQACRAVDGETEHDALEAARTNACALLASGVTDSMACGRTTPSRTACGPRP